MKTKKPSAQEIAKAKEILKNAGYISIFWSKQDVEDKAIDMEVELSERDVDTITEKIEKYHDANEGINWEVIECHINMHLDDKK